MIFGAGHVPSRQFALGAGKRPRRPAEFDACILIPDIKALVLQRFYSARIPLATALQAVPA